MSDDHINIFYSEADGGTIADIPDLEARMAFGALAAEWPSIRSRPRAATKRSRGPRFEE